MLAVTALDIDGELADAAAAEAWALVTASDSAAAIASVSANLAWTHFGRGRHRVGTELLDRALARLSSGAVPIFLRLNRAWGALLGGAEQEAINGFAQVVSANPTGLEDRKSAEAYLGAAIAMVRSGHPNAAELLDGALSLASATGLVLTAWQQDLVAASRGQVGNPVGQPPTVAAVTRGARLFALLHQACDPLAGPTGSLSRGDRSADRPNR